MTAMSGVCLTGDVHSLRLANAEQAYLPTGTTELDIASRYAKIAADHDVAVTFFVTGLAARDQPNLVSTIDSNSSVEVGGHTYRSLQPRHLHSVFRRIWGSRYGPSAFQRYDVRKTKAVLTGLSTKPTSWRTHAYASDHRTLPILAREGFTVVSDSVVPDSTVSPSMEGKILSLPVNTLRDHGHLYHAHRTAESTESTSSGDSFNSQMYEPDAWLSRVISQIEAITNAGGFATVQAHPVCQYTADELDTLTELIRWLDDEGIDTYCCRDIPYPT
jgi:hypothetical protein